MPTFSGRTTSLLPPIHLCASFPSTTLPLTWPPRIRHVPITLNVACSLLQTELQQHLVELLSRWISVQFASLRLNPLWIDAFANFMEYLKRGSELKDVAYRKQIKRAWNTEKASLWSVPHISFYGSPVRHPHFLTTTHSHKDIAESPRLNLLEITPTALAQQLTFLDQAMLNSTPLAECRAWADRGDVDRGKLGHIFAILEVYDAPPLEPAIF